MGEEQDKVDADTKVMLYEFKDDIIDVIKEQNKELKEALTEATDLKLKNVNETQDRFAEHHEKHFKETRQIDTKIQKAITDHVEATDSKGQFKWTTAIGIISLAGVVILGILALL